MRQRRVAGYGTGRMAAAATHGSRAQGHPAGFPRRPPIRQSRLSRRVSRMSRFDFDETLVRRQRMARRGGEWRRARRGLWRVSWMSRLVFSETSPSLVRRSAAYGVSGQWGYAACAVGLAATKAFERRSAADGRRCTADRSPGQAPMGWRPALAGMQGRDPSLEVCREHPRCRGKLPCIRVIRCWSAKKLSLRRDTLHGPAGEGRIASGGSGRVTSAWRRHESGGQGRPWRGPVGLT